ncbi:hypothetical protein [Prosthecobacter sp.]|uniref:hypothetical protein n=1 Tax=Prosthecobacter sp. TaxID=1965333 RepID=UPI0025D39A0B|nr:hypothetical protein [Prosthecobacter sp.]
MTGERRVSQVFHDWLVCRGGGWLLAGGDDDIAQVKLALDSEFGMVGQGRWERWLEGLNALFLEFGRHLLVHLLVDLFAHAHAGFAKRLAGLLPRSNLSM